LGSTGKNISIGLHNLDKGLTGIEINVGSKEASIKGGEGGIGDLAILLSIAGRKKRDARRERRKRGKRFRIVSWVGGQKGDRYRRDRNETLDEKVSRVKNQGKLGRQ